MLYETVHAVVVKWAQQQATRAAYTYVQEWNEIYTSTYKVHTYT